MAQRWGFYDRGKQNWKTRWSVCRVKFVEGEFQDEYDLAEHFGKVNKDYYAIGFPMSLNLNGSYFYFYCVEEICANTDKRTAKKIIELKHKDESYMAQTLLIQGEDLTHKDKSLVISNDVLNRLNSIRLGNLHYLYELSCSKGLSGNDYHLMINAPIQEHEL